MKNLMNKPITKFKDIPQFPFACYNVCIAWEALPDWLARQNKDIMKLEMNPTYQRGYVWTEEQKISFVEYQLKGGFSGRDIFWNCPTWMSFSDPINIIELVDGKQRINAVLDFMDNKIKAFGLYCYEFEDELSSYRPEFIFHVNNLKDRKQILDWYLGMNTGGSIHTEADLKPAYEELKLLDKSI